VVGFCTHRKVCCCGVLLQMSHPCPFSDESHVPAGPRTMASRRGLRRHLLMCHGCLLRSEVGASGERRDTIVLCQAQDLTTRLEAARRAQTHRVAPAALGTSAAASDPPSAEEDLVVPVSPAGPPASASAPPSVELPARVLSTPAPLAASWAAPDPMDWSFDLSGGEDLAWAGVQFLDSMPELARPVSHLGTAGRSSPGDPSGPVAVGASSGPATGARRVTVRGGQAPEVGRPMVDSASQTDYPDTLEVIRLSELAAQTAFARPLGHPHLLARDVAHFFGLGSVQERRMADLAVMSAVALQRLLTDHLSQSAARGLVLGASAEGHLRATLAQLSLYGGRPLVFHETRDWEVPGPMLALPEPAIVVSDGEISPEWGPSEENSREEQDGRPWEREQ
jgi:hypothetical protein